MSEQSKVTVAEEALHEAASTAVNQSAKADAVTAAMQAFDQAQSAQQSAVSEANEAEPKKNAISSQGFGYRLRLMFEPNNIGHGIMKTLSNKWLFSGVAAASVTLVTGVAVWQNPHLWQAQKETLIFEQAFIKPAQIPQQNQLPQGSERVGAVTDATETKSMVVQPAAKPKWQQPSPVQQEQQAAELVAGAGQLERAKEEIASSAQVFAEADMAMAPASDMALMAAPPAEHLQARSAMPATSFIVEEEIVLPPQYREEGRDDFETFEENPVKRVKDEPVSTFSIDVDTASYSFVRRQLNEGVLPQKDAVRLEEMVNYFDYQYPLPEKKAEPFATHVTVMDSPWNASNKLIHVGIQGYELAREAKPKTNLVFLLDVSGSMSSPDKLPLVKQSMELLLSQLSKDDRVAIAVYAGAAGTVLEPTPAYQKQTIMNALNQLQAGGSTAGGAGIKLAYQLAKDSFDEDAVNRVILATDGDFNVGITDHEELKGFVERQREEGIFLSVLGFGQGNYNDHIMQALAQNGNGIAAYIDTLSEAQKVLVNEATSALFPIAKDVKIQMQFNPATVSEYRLLGYETRALNREDFNNDAVDAGDIGAGHSVTAIYEITPVGEDVLIEPSRYEVDAPEEKSEKTNEYGFLRLRYKLPAEDTSRLIEQPVTQDAQATALLKREANFATAVAGFAQILKGGKYLGEWDYDQALELAQANKGADEYGYRTEFVQLIRKAKTAAAL